MSIESQVWSASSPWMIVPGSRATRKLPPAARALAHGPSRKPNHWREQPLPQGIRITP